MVLKGAEKGGAGLDSRHSTETLVHLPVLRMGELTRTAQVAQLVRGLASIHYNRDGNPP